MVWYVCLGLLQIDDAMVLHTDSKHIALRLLDQWCMSMPEDLSNTSCSDMSIEIKCCLIEVSALALLFIDMKLLASRSKTEKKICQI